MDGVKIGTCSWNYDSWVGLVYPERRPTAAGYLREYAKGFRTAEIDSWFYKLPDPGEVRDYMAGVDPGFTFTVKASQDLTLTHRRGRGAKDPVRNPDFLSPQLFASYVDRIRPMLPRIDAVMLEFEYLNREKMESLDAFLRALEAFLPSVPGDVPLAVETRNKNYLKPEYFRFLREKGILHVFSEKQYMPHVYEVYLDFRDEFTGTSVIRLLGGDRREMEERTGGRWDRIVEERPDKGRIVEMAKDIVHRGGKAVINVNNHYEGSAPLTILSLEKDLDTRTVGRP